MNDVKIDPDAVFERLARMGEGLGAAERANLYAKLILILSDMVGDEARIIEAIEMACAGGHDASAAQSAQ